MWRRRGKTITQAVTVSRNRNFSNGLGWSRTHATVGADMNREYHKWYSPRLGRDMELLVFGHTGLPVIVFPTSGGRYYEFEDRGMVGALGGKIDAGQLQLYCA